MQGERGRISATQIYDKAGKQTVWKMFPKKCPADKGTPNNVICC